MNPREALAAGRLSEALALQQTQVACRPDDAASRLFLFELLALAGRISDARDQLAAIRSKDPAWPASRRRFLWLLKAIRRRSRNSKPLFLSPPPSHARWRWRGCRALRGGSDNAATYFDRADSEAPHVVGHIDGREFQGLRDTDDRFASLFEAFVGPEYIWLPFEQVRRLTLAPAAGALDTAFRPAHARLTDGTELEVVLPLVYPGSADDDDAFAMGQDADWQEPVPGVTCGTGARVLMAGEEELILGECRQFELRGR